MKTKLIILSFFLSTTVLIGQTVELDVVFKGDKVGHTTVSRKNYGGGKMYYELNSETNVEMLFVKRAIKTNFTAYYENGFLTRCSSRYEVNGEVDSYMSAVWDGAKYVIESERGKSTYDKKVQNSVLTLFFAEPVGKSNLWSERIGEIIPLSSRKTGEYSFKNPVKNGSTNIYKYIKGKLYEVEMSTPVGPSFMRLK
jgi:hypothetical protein